MNNVIELDQVTFGYDHRKVIENMCLQIRKGDFISLIGDNGSGKSTLLKLLLGILSPESGDIRMLGCSLNKFKAWNQVGYVPQESQRIYSSFPATVKEIVVSNLYSKIGLFRGPKKEHYELVDKALEKVGMQEMLNRRMGEMSGGQQQRIMLARALVNDPKILFLDEPVSGIDVTNKELFMKVIEEMNHKENMTIVLVNHEKDYIDQFSNRTIHIAEEAHGQKVLKETKIHGYI